MKVRATNPNQLSWKNYGGRGIGVCEKWAKSFPDFLADVGRRPSLKHCLERLDNNRGYEPGNVGWATREAQNFNKRTNRLVAGAPLTMTAHAHGIDRSTLRMRLSRGMAEGAALETPLNFRQKLVLIEGKLVCVAEAERLLMMRSGTLKSRLRRGMNPEEAVSRPLGRWI